MSLSSYLLAGMAILALVAGLYGAIERSRRLGAEIETTRLMAEVQAKEADLKLAAETNAANARNVERMLEQAAEDQRIQADLAGRLADITASLDETRAQISDLEANDATVRDYLAGLLPPGLFPLVNKPARAH